MTTDLGQILGNILKALTAGWASFAALGSFLVYLFGYLSLRFHLTAFGITTELAVLDERYLFAGFRFLVYLCTAVPIIVLLGLLAVAVGWLLFYLPYRVLPAFMQERISVYLAQRWQTLKHWWSPPTRLALAGIVLSVALIQFVMRECFVFSNLLVRESLPGPEWLKSLLLNEYDGFRSLFFAGLMAGVSISGGLLFLALTRATQTFGSRLLTALLDFLVAVQVLLLPVNHGILIADLTAPRVASVAFNTEKANLSDSSQDIWQIWEGQESLTFLVRDKRDVGKRRTLVTLPRKEVMRIEIRNQPVRARPQHTV
jgi:hypothetical protein